MDSDSQFGGTPPGNTLNGTGPARCPFCAQQMRGTDWINMLLQENETLRAQLALPAEARPTVADLADQRAHVDALTEIDSLLDALKLAKEWIEVSEHQTMERALEIEALCEAKNKDGYNALYISACRAVLAVLSPQLHKAAQAGAEDRGNPEPGKEGLMTNDELLDALIQIVAPNGEPPLEGAIALRRDAGRYRWLREHSCQHDSAGNTAESWSTHSDPTSLDRAVDESLLQQLPQRGSE